VDLALYQPEIPQNTGTLLRLGACMGVTVHIIEPCGFVLSDRRLRRSGMDYVDTVHMVRHASWDDFWAARVGRRCVLLAPRASHCYIDFRFQPGDILLLGKESCGVPVWIQDMVEASVFIPMYHNMRSLNVAIAAAMVLGEALRQTGLLPSCDPLLSSIKA
jgi:tRNA (cytidine/uridine-2'-O-)-methyltransferase